MRIYVIFIDGKLYKKGYTRFSEAEGKICNEPDHPNRVETEMDEGIITYALYRSLEHTYELRTVVLG